MARGAGPGASWPARFPFSSRTFSFLLHSFLPPSLGRPGRSSTVGSGGARGAAPVFVSLRRQSQALAPHLAGTGLWGRGREGGACRLLPG